MATKQGSLSINSENIFPIIKKWLYSDHDIFFRELISNGCDAVTKLRKLALMGETEREEDVRDAITVILDEKAGTLRFRDTGIGMTMEDVDEYINQIAFSGATAFLEKYKDKTNEDQIIGHFGLGFYSAFMVADKVTISTLSYQPGATPVFWECEGGTEYTMSEGQKDQIGTEITLYLNPDSLEFAKEYRAREIISKYCSFMPVEIFLFTAEQWNHYLEEDQESVGEEEEKEESKEYRPQDHSLSDVNPLWTKRPGDCTPEEYQEFYRKVFMDFKEPLFWIHLNMDYPFNLKGILYFPKINLEYESLEGTIKLYNNRVFIADNIKEVIPEFLLLLKGVIDCPDLPLNVSRSALQNDGFVKKISDYITKKVADKLNGLCNTERETYEKYWDDISPFIKFGCLKDEKFYERMQKSLLFKGISEGYCTLEDLNAAEDKVVVYVTDEVQQSQYIKMYQDAQMEAVLLNQNIDNAFITMLEQKNEELSFRRIDADLKDQLKGEPNEEALKESQETLEALFRKALGKENLTVQVEDLKNEKIAAMITISEENRRMQEMMRMYGMAQLATENEVTLVLNLNHPLVAYVKENKEGENAKVFCRQLYDLAMLSHRPLTGEEMEAFLDRSHKIMLSLR